MYHPREHDGRDVERGQKIHGGIAIERGGGRRSRKQFSAELIGPSSPRRLRTKLICTWICTTILCGCGLSKIARTR